ncbi:membrane protein [Bacteroidia bacterium]|nr:membrane protein [Bacteroidia bacterium]
MKKLLFATLLFIVGCSENFLITEPEGSISGNQLDNMANQNLINMIAPLIQGLYRTTFESGTGGTIRGDDYGQKSVDLCMDVMSCDVGSTGTTGLCFTDVYNYQAQASTGINTDMIWRYYYTLIKGANKIFDTLDGDAQIPENDIAKSYYGQAKIIRASSYFYLVNLYQHPYSDRKDASGVPVYRTQKELEPHAQSSVREVYNLIITDLEDAIVALENFDRGADKLKADKYVANGFLAYTYLMRGEDGDCAKAAEAAGKVIDSGKFPLMTAEEIINSGFRSVNTGSWLWGVNMTIENTQGSMHFWGNMDYFSYGYCFRGAIRVIDADLYESIPDSDIRKQQFGNPASGNAGEAPLAAFCKFYDAQRIPGGDRVYTNDLLYMRSEEMVLIKSEALARLGNTAASSKSLKPLISLRDQIAAAHLENLNNDELLETIWFNWRTELWGEGKTYLAMKRYKKTMHRSSQPKNHIFLAGKSFPYNYERMIFEIPEYEWLNNPNLVPQQ